MAAFTLYIYLTGDLLCLLPKQQAIAKANSFPSYSKDSQTLVTQRTVTFALWEKYQAFVSKTESHRTSRCDWSKVGSIARGDIKRKHLAQKRLTETSWPSRNASDCRRESHSVRCEQWRGVTGFKDSHGFFHVTLSGWAGWSVYWSFFYGKW